MSWCTHLRGDLLRAVSGSGGHTQASHQSPHRAGEAFSNNLTVAPTTDCSCLVREIVAVCADLPADPKPKDWGRVVKVLIEEAERRTASLKTNLAAIGAGGKLCEVVDRVEPGQNAGL